MRVMQQVAVLMLLLLSGWSLVEACSCACDPNYTTDRWIKEAGGIFVGRVLEGAASARPPLAADGGDQLEVVSSCGEETIPVEVRRVLKGSLPSRVSLVRDAIGTPCDLPFGLRPGHKYLFFVSLRPRDGALLVSGCSPTRPAWRAESLIAKVESSESMHE